MASRFFNPVPQFVDQNGDPLVSGTLTFYYTGTSSLKDTYADEAATIPNANPITLNSVGASPVEIWLDDEYRIVLKNASATVVWDRDPVSGTAGGGGSGTVTVIETYADLIAFTTAANDEVVEMLGYYTVGDGGGGRFYWNATSTATANAGTIVQATAVATGRFLALYESPINLKRFGLTGDGVTDNSARFNAAINAYVGQNGVQFYLPTGNYNVASTVDFSVLDGQNFVLEGDGFRTGTTTPGTVITGSIAGDLVKFFPAVNVNSTCNIKNVSFINTSTNAAAISLHLEHISSSTIERCQILCAGGFGLYAPDNTFSVMFLNCAFRGNYITFPTGITAYVKTHCHFIGCDITSGYEGLRIAGTGCMVHGGRVEVNKTGITIGLDAAGASALVSSASITTVTLEANDVGLNVASTAAFRASELAIFGSPNSPSSNSKVGINIGGATNAELHDIQLTGTFTDVGIRGSGAGASQSVSFENVTVGNTITTRLWDIQGGLDQYTFRNTNYTLRPDDAVTQPFIQEQNRSQYLAGVDYLNAMKRGKNLRGLNIVVVSGAATKAIAFTGTGHAAGNAAINTATAGAVAGTLPAGTYYYLATAVTAHGECGGTSEKTVVIGGANNGTTVAFFGMTADGFKRRIYRGTVSGTYDGYYEMALNSNSNFVDTNATFDGIKQPPTAGYDNTAMVEPDANYAVIVNTGWDNGGTWVTSKATTGFTVNWKTNPGSDSYLDYFIIR